MLEASLREHIDVLVVEDRRDLDHTIPESLNGVTIDIQVRERGAELVLSDHQVGVVAVDRSLGRHRIGRLIRTARQHDSEVPIIVIGERSVGKRDNVTVVPRDNLHALAEAVFSFPHRLEQI